MIRVSHLLILCVLVLGGCSTVQSNVVNIVEGDLSKAIARGEALLGSDDALVLCYKALNDVLKAEKAAGEFDDGLLLDFAMRARILQKTRDRVGPVLQKACGEITFEVMMQAARRGR